MYEYKMYGSFSDVTAEEFLYVQNDLSKFRLSWDNRCYFDIFRKILKHLMFRLASIFISTTFLFSTKQLTKVDDDEENSVVYYWEINWPRFFSNRDYCCHRSVQVNRNPILFWSA